MEAEKGIFRHPQNAATSFLHIAGSQFAKVDLHKL